MPKPARLAHVVYQTRRFEAMLQWYRTVFEAHEVSRNPALAFLTFDDEHHRFAFINLEAFRPDQPAAAAASDVGVNHVAWTFASVGDLLENYARLKAAGITPYWPIHHGPTLSLYYRDPDGNRMEFQVDACSADEANAYMRSDAFAANPIGVPIDPDALLAQHRRGVPAAQLLRMPQGPASPIPSEHGLS
jgi:catechol 2,3-dioxygenase-like lactoylglutathione lyase family enzyme